MWYEFGLGIDTSFPYYFLTNSGVFGTLEIIAQTTRTKMYTL